MAQRQVLWRESALKRIRSCGKAPLGSAIAIRKRDGVAHFAGLETCGSVHACPVCMAKILTRRAGEVSAAADNWYRAGNSVVMLNLTMAHDDAMRLGKLLKVVAKAWRNVQGTRRWRALRDCYELEHLIKSLEHTHGDNGWHPHLHVLVFFRGELTAAALAEVGAYIKAKWSAELVKAGYRPCDPVHGVTLVPCYSAAEAGAYIAKTTDGRAVGNEMARADLKRGRGNHRTPNEILENFRLTGDKRDLMLWREYERATKGHQRISWSNGARAELLPGPEESDEEIASEEVGGDLLGTVGRNDWYRKVVPVMGRPAAVLEAAEAGPGELRRVLAAVGVTLDERGPP
jgi:hypothetical protein